VTFEVYNYIDCVNWVPAQKTFCASGEQATVAASGLHFKIHPNGNKEHEFLVAPRQAYIYRGPGKSNTYRPELPATAPLAFSATGAASCFLANEGHRLRAQQICSRHAL